MKSAGSVIARRVLPNGLVIISETMPHVRSVSLGIWLHAGSRRERPALNGIAHFIEHMVFKGTSHRSAENIAREMDSVGGLLDAFTTKESVCFNAKVLDEHLPIAFDVLSDLVLRPLFAEEDVVREKQVVLEEIKMEEDNPESLAHEVLMQDFWRGHPLGAPILGTSKTVRQFTRNAVLGCFRDWYAAHNTIITAAGHIEMDRLAELVSAAFGERRREEAKNRNGRGARARNGDGHPAGQTPHAHARLQMRNKPALEQVHLILAAPAYPLADPRRYAASILNNILGGGMSSRLFQNIRERQGLAYAVFSEISPFSDAGMFSIYAGTSRNKVERVLRSVAEEFRHIKQEAVAAEELRRAKDHLKGSLLLSLESSSARMSNLARQEMYFGRFFTMDELQRSIEAVTPDEVQRIAQEFFEPEKIAVTALGPLDGVRLTRDLLAC